MALSLKCTWLASSVAGVTRHDVARVGACAVHAHVQDRKGEEEGAPDNPARQRMRELMGELALPFPLLPPL